MIIIMRLLVIAALITACNQSGSESGSDGSWLSGSDEEKFALIEKHLRGFDMAMVETDHRYVELYWAGQDENWSYTAYQVTKIRTAIENGIERRPKRANSAQMIFPVLEELQAAIEAKDPGLFQQRFQTLTVTCNACHQVEDVSFATVAPPEYRASSIRP